MSFENLAAYDPELALHFTAVEESIVPMDPPPVYPAVDPGEGQKANLYELNSVIMGMYNDEKFADAVSEAAVTSMSATSLPPGQPEMAGVDTTFHMSSITPAEYQACYSITKDSMTQTLGNPPVTQALIDALLHYDPSARAREVQMSLIRAMNKTGTRMFVDQSPNEYYKLAPTVRAALKRANPNMTLPLVQPLPVITSPLTLSVQVGKPMRLRSYMITADNAPISFGATGLPAGLLVNTSNGEISGTATGAGVTNVTISATNQQGTGSATLVITAVLSP